jgi:hypothetical protein
MRGTRDAYRNLVRKFPGTWHLETSGEGRIILENVSIKLVSGQN